MPSPRIDRRTFLKALCAGVPLSLAGAGTPRAESRRPPNVVLIFADDLDFDELGVYDHLKFPCTAGAIELGFTPARNRWEGRRIARQLTPNIDSLARDGAVFSRFYMTTAICTPSRYSLLTGRYASRSPRFIKDNPVTGQANIQWNTQLDPWETNIARSMREFGYATGMVGKWHLGSPVGRVKGVPADAQPTDERIGRELRSTHEGLRMYLTGKIGFDFADRVYMQNKEWMGLPTALQVHNLEWLTEGALNFIDHNFDRPFFLYMSLTTPHGGYNANFLKDDPRFTPAGVLDRIPQGMPSRTAIPGRLRAAKVPLRNAMGTWIDDSVGAVLGRLEQLQLAEDTVVILTSDHQSRGKYTCYEGCRVPFIVRWPRKIRGGMPVDSLCANTDIPATLIDLAGGRPPKDMAGDGRSIVPLFEGRTDGWRRSLLLECSNIRAVVTDRYKYIANRPTPAARERMDEEARRSARTGQRRRIGWDGSENPHRWEKGVRYSADWSFPAYFDSDQLYDLEEDVFEQKNLASSPSHSREFGELRELLKKHLKDLPHPFPV